MMEQANKPEQPAPRHCAAAKQAYTETGRPPREERFHAKWPAPIMFLAMLTGIALVMFLYELGKETWAPQLTKWGSHLVTILVSSVIGASAGHLALKRQRAVNARLRDEIAERVRAEKSLKVAYQEKQGLLRELQHRVKNSFSMIAGMISLMLNDGKTRETKHALDEIRSRVLAISGMYDLLNSGDSITEVRLDKYLIGIASSLKEYSRQISLTCSFDAVSIQVKTAIPVGLIATELLTNSYKHAFPGDRAGTISMLLRKTPAGAALEVADDGVGLPGGFDFTTIDSLGLKLVYSLARQIGGSVTIEGTGGVKCVVDIPIPGSSAR